jgi:hypothetical protein
VLITFGMSLEYRWTCYVGHGLLCSYRSSNYLCGCTFHGLDPLAYSDSESTSETVNLLKIVW